MTVYTGRNAGQAATIAADDAVNRQHRAYIRAALASIQPGESFTADDVRDLAEDAAQIDGHTFDPAPNLIPAVIGGWAAAGRIVRVGERVSRRRTRHASRNAIWRAA